MKCGFFVYYLYMESGKKLYRSRTDRIVSGVCGGLAAYFGIDPTLVRVAFILLCLADGIGILVYIVLVIIVPTEPGDPVDIDREKKVKEFAQGIGDQAKRIAEDFSQHPERRIEGKNLAALIVILVGVLWLMSLVMPFGWFQWNYVWPLALIIIGITFIVKK